MSIVSDIGLMLLVEHIPKLFIYCVFVISLGINLQNNEIFRLSRLLIAIIRMDEDGCLDSQPVYIKLIFIASS